MTSHLFISSVIPSQAHRKLEELQALLPESQNVRYYISQASLVALHKEMNIPMDGSDSTHMSKDEDEVEEDLNVS